MSSNAGSCPPGGVALSVRLHFTGRDGLPDDDALENGRVAFLWGDRVITGSPAGAETGVQARGDCWEDDHGERYLNVTHWLEFPAPLGELAHGIFPEAVA